MHFTKATSDGRAEAALLRLVEGPGIVPVLGADEHRLALARAECSIADVLADRGRLRPHEVRGVIVAAAVALARVHAVGLVHGDLKPANLLLTGDGDLWLADFDAAGPCGAPRLRHSPDRGAGPVLSVADDVRALLSTAIECAVGHPVDLAAAWSALQLTKLGCPADLAAQLAPMLRRPPAAATVASMLATDDAALPSPAVANGADRTPTVPFSLLGCS